MDASASDEYPRVVPYPSCFEKVHGGKFLQIPAYKSVKHVNVKQRWRGKTIEEVFQTEFRYSTSDVDLACTSGNLIVNGKAAVPDQILYNGDKIDSTVTIEEPAIRPDPIWLLAEFEAEPIAVVSKPSGIPTHSQGVYQKSSLTAILKDVLKWNYAHPLNRLDRGTSGVVVIARSPKAAKNISLSENKIKFYVAQVKGTFPSNGEVVCRLKQSVRKHEAFQPLTAMVDETANGQECESRFLNLESASSSKNIASYVLARPITGRTHQLRVHLAALGHSILGDTTYAHGVKAEPDGWLPTSSFTHGTNEISNAANRDESVNPSRDEDVVEPILRLHAFAYGICGKIVYAPLPSWCCSQLEQCAKDGMETMLRSDGTESSEGGEVPDAKRPKS